MRTYLSLTPCYVSQFICHTFRHSLSNRQQFPSGKQIDFKLLLYNVIKKYCLENVLGGGGLYLVHGLCASSLISDVVKMFLTDAASVVHVFETCVAVNRCNAPSVLFNVYVFVCT